MFFNPTVERSNFRDIMRTVLDYEPPSFTVKRKDEIIELNCWSKKIQYDVFCLVLESGCQIHLGENQLVRDVLDLGAVPINSVGDRKFRVSTVSIEFLCVQIKILTL